MNLPSYFYADLPPETALSPITVAEGCFTLKRNRARFLADRPTGKLVMLLSEVAEGWLQSDNPFRRLALEAGPIQCGFSPATFAAGLDSFFQQLTPDNLNALLTQDLGHSRRLDQFCAGAGESAPNRAAILRGPELIVHIAGGRIPIPALMSLVLGLLARSAQILKCASGQSLLPRLFAHSIHQADPTLGACIEIAHWRGGHTGLETVLFEHADCITATGSDETLDIIRAMLPLRTRFLAYGHRVSFAFVSANSFHGGRAKQIVAQAGEDVVAWDQLGCLSPHIVYVQTGANVTPETFAALLAGELDRREAQAPRCALAPDDAALIASRRAAYDVRAAHSPDTKVWRSADSTAWTVVFEADPQFQISCLNRFIYVKPVKDVDEALENAAPVRGAVSTVGLAASAGEAPPLAARLARWGVTRVCPLGQMQRPPLTWRHDGRPALADLLTWTDWEM